jgi:calcineurin-like phosphoesterase family protein
MKIYTIADLHINHQRIIEYTSRPFENVQLMNKHIIDQWNKVVTDDDIILILGDFGFGSAECLTHIINCLHGYKVLIMGNHDKHKSITWWLNVGFNKVFKKKIIVENFIFSHEPTDTPPDMLNYHGHIHNTQLQIQFSPINHVCVSVECVNYTPILLECDDNLKEKIALLGGFYENKN